MYEFICIFHTMNVVDISDNSKDWDHNDVVVYWLSWISLIAISYRLGKWDKIWIGPV